MDALEQDAPLCARCRTIDFDAIFQLSKDVRDARLEGVPIKSLGSNISDPNTPCPMCDLFDKVKFDLNVSARQSTWDTSQYHLRAFSSILKEVGVTAEMTTEPKQRDIIKQIRRGNTYMSDESNSVFLAVFPGSGDDIFITSELKIFDICSHLEQSVIMPVKGSDIANLRTHGVRVSPSQINYTRLKEWMESCQSHHGPRCTCSPTPPPFVLKVIDCQTRQIVPLQPGWKYFALSYVWGPLSAEESTVRIQKPEAMLPDKVHGTIKDAIRVVNNLGGRYLWVDKYCIDQDNAQEKHDQISHMDLIYSGAYATIIAAGSDISISGLPGVGAVPRRRQPQATSPTASGTDLRLVSTLPSIRRALATSPWISRGWTFQEVILSRRCLFFTDFQVYYMCGVTTNCESTVLSSVHLSLMTTAQTATNLARDHILDSSRFTYQITQHPAYYSSRPYRPWTFRTHLSDYSSRSLSYNSDAINAFRGILARSDHPTFYGIPFLFGGETSYTLARDPNFRFVCALSWEPIYQPPCKDDCSANGEDGHLIQRKEFPSWSWAGWIGQVSYHYFLWDRRFGCAEEDLLPQELDGHQPVRIWICFNLHESIDHISTGNIPIEEFFVNHNSALWGNMMPEVSPFLQIECTVLHCLQIKLLSISSGTASVPAFRIVIGDGYSRAPVLFCGPPHCSNEDGMIEGEYTGLVLFERRHSIALCTLWDHIGIFVLLVKEIQGGRKRHYERVGSAWLDRAEFGKLGGDGNMKMRRETISLS
ncbi:HET domain-containing protein [Aspergillus vadensis CBS 113365]|uniref:HET-domain-containing protein n=1 Tax=Aspergillus vadensis (strain CBS 113365 / IMI 142717 / IBT 24658) TaxID=1448311 RepID=A0A319ATH4_ASPVC|nr:HET-domain-containing protein [Aspergillus vadensis CBS 113365]PYH63637.1 HET-domain-containing protein [Aspergillus vadensis CBS 113365]